VKIVGDVDSDMTGNVGKNVTKRSVRVTIITVENKNKSITYPERASVALVIQNAMRTRRTILSFVIYDWLYHILPQ
jgi:hypothetical protein